MQRRLCRHRSLCRPEAAAPGLLSQVQRKLATVSGRVVTNLHEAEPWNTITVHGDRTILLGVVKIGGGIRMQIFDRGEDRIRFLE